MNITSVSGAAGTANVVQPVSDDVSKRIRQQIAEAERKSQELSQNEDMTPEEKLQKKQEIQQQIAQLNAQLRQHQAEMQRERQQEAAASMDNMLDSGKNAAETKEYSVSISEEGMRAFAAAEAAKDISSSLGRVATKIEGEMRVAAAEIKTDMARGGCSDAKIENLGDLEGRLSSIRGSQAKELSKAAEELKEATEEEADDKKEEDGKAGAEEEAQE